MRIQCKSNAHQSCPHCIVRNQIHVWTLISSGHTSTQLPWRPCQIFTSASHHIASQVEQIRGSPKHTHCWYVTQACMPCPFWSHVQRAIARSRSIWIGRVRIQCGRAQTGFDPVQCALGVQCGQAFRHKANNKRAWMQPSISYIMFAILFFTSTHITSHMYFVTKRPNTVN